ncbi:MAG: alpha/beta fold hydrolase [Sulfurifustis sp.]
MQQQKLVSTEPRLSYLDDEQRGFRICASAKVFTEASIEADDGMPLSVLQAGVPGRPVVLLVNALGVSCLFLAEIARRLATTYHVITWESRGLPNELPLPEHADLSVERHARDAAAILACERVQPKAVVAYCAGANVAAYALTRRMMNAERLCIISPSMHMGADLAQTDYQRTMLPLWEKIAASGPRYAALVRVLLQQGARPEAGTIDYELFCLNNLPFRSNESTYRYARLQAECLRVDWPTLLGEIRLPTLVLHGDEDDMIHAETSAAVARHIAGAALRTIPAGHFAVHTSSALHDEVATFLSAAEAPRAQAGGIR